MNKELSNFSSFLLYLLALRTTLEEKKGSELSKVINLFALWVLGIKLGIKGGVEFIFEEIFGKYSKI